MVNISLAVNPVVGAPSALVVTIMAYLPLGHAKHMICERSVTDWDKDRYKHETENSIDPDTKAQTKQQKFMHAPDDSPHSKRPTRPVPLRSTNLEQQILHGQRATSLI